MTDKKNIVIVGGGIQGCTTAYFLTRHPKYDRTKHSITLLEATSIAAGASGKAGGLLALWAYPSSLVPLSFRLHAELAKEHGGDHRWGYRRLYAGQITCNGEASARAVNGTASTKAGNVTGLHSTDGAVAGNVSLKKHDHSSLASKGAPSKLDWVNPDSVIHYDSMGSPDDTAQVHPYQFTTSMAQLATEQGVKIHINAQVTSIKSSTKSGVESVTYTDRKTGDSHTVDSVTDVVITAGPWTPSVWPDAPISALRAHSVTLEPTDRDNPVVSPYALFTHIGYKSTSKGRPKTVTPEIYPRPDGTLYACGEGDQMIPLPATADLVETSPQRCQDIIDHVSSVSDTMATSTVTGRNACYLPQNDYGGSPLVGLLSTPGMFMAAGHTCWGIQNGPATGKIMSEYVLDGKVSSVENVEGLDPRKFGL